MLRKIWIVLGAVALFTSTSLSGVFPGQVFPTGRWPRSVAAGDFDQDGRLDLVTANEKWFDVTVLMGHGDGTFAPGEDYSTGNHQPGSIAVGDLHQDGREDLVTANERSNAVTVLLGNGDGTFATLSSYAVGHGPYSIALGDFDQDGRTDVVTSNVYSDDVTLLLGHGDGTFNTPVSYAAGDHPGSVAVGDFDPETASRTWSRRIRDRAICRYCWAVATGRSVTFDAAGNDPWSVVVGDFDRDGRQDLAVSNRWRFRDRANRQRGRDVCHGRAIRRRLASWFHRGGRPRRGWLPGPCHGE